MFWLMYKKTNFYSHTLIWGSDLRKQCLSYSCCREVFLNMCGQISCGVIQIVVFLISFSTSMLGNFFNLSGIPVVSNSLDPDQA